MKDDEMGETCKLGEMTTAYKILIEKPEGKRPLARPNRMW
jgi:hypothetical protein